MNEQRVRRLVGLSFILGAILINVPYFILIATFDYPTILREPTAVILTRFQAGGPSLVLTWLAFAWVGLPLLFALVPAVTEARVLGLPLPWLLLGVLAYPMLWLAAWYYVRHAERNESEFADVLHRR